MNTSFVKIGCRAICSLVCTLLCVVFVCFISASIDSSFSETWKNNSARIDIYPSKGDNLVLDLKTDANITRPKWLQKSTGNGAVLDFTLFYWWRTKTIELLSDKDGEVTITLRAPDKKSVSVFVDYQNLSVNEKAVSLPNTRIEYATSFKYVFSVKAGQPVKIALDMKKPFLAPWSYQHINPYVLFSVSVLLFVVFYRVFGMLWIRRTVRGCDIFLVIVFFVSLFIPMLRISNAEKSDQENRTLAKAPRFLRKGDVNNNFGKDFDQWFNDRFYGREFVVSIFSKIPFYLNRVYENNDRIYLAKSKWMFDLSRRSSPSKSKQLLIEDALRKVNNFCQQHHIKFYLLLVPKKEFIYQDILQDSYGYDVSTISDLNSYIKKLQQNMPFPVIYPYEQIAAAKQQDHVYFKTEHHWTHWGAYNGYQALIQTIQKDFPDIELAKLDQFTPSQDTLIHNLWRDNLTIGDTTRLLNIDPEYAKKNILIDQYTYYTGKENLKISRTKFTLDFQQPSGKHKVFLIGNSQGDNLINFLPYSAHRTKYIRTNNGQYPDGELYKILKHYKQDILDFKPDIFVLAVSSSILNVLSDLAKED